MKRGEEIGVSPAFARIERWRDAATDETHWRTISRENLTQLYGDSPASRIADPEDRGLAAAAVTFATFMDTTLSARRETSIAL